MKSFFALLLALGLLPCAAQMMPPPPPKDPFPFRGNVLGMSFVDFKARNSYIVVSMPTIVTEGRHKKTVYHDVRGPFCSDQYADKIPGYISQDSDDLVCDVGWNQPGRTDMGVAGARMEFILYEFHAGRLCMIEMAFNSNDFFILEEALTSKYGPPAKHRESRIQNVFGAAWPAIVDEWIAGTQSIELAEGSGNGPGQPMINARGSLLYIDRAVVPQRTKVKVDF